MTQYKCILNKEVSETLLRWHEIHGSRGGASEMIWHTFQILHVMRSPCTLIEESKTVKIEHD